MAVVRVLGAAVLCALTVACSSPTPTPEPARAAGSASPTTAGTFPPVPTTGLPAARSAALQQELARWVDTDLLSGVTGAVVTQDGVWSGAAGVDGAGTPLVADAAMAIASITKTFVAAEVMHLVEAGKVDLDAAASSYLDHPQTSNGVTVRQLLSMRSGLVSPPEGAFAAVDADLERHWDAVDVLAVYTTPPGEPGGARPVYENANYWLLGLLVEEVTGRPLPEVLRADLWQPRGLSRIAYQDEEAIAPPLARPGPDDGNLPDDLPAGDYLPWRSLASAVGAAGGIAADAPTIARWGYQLYGGHVLGVEATREMRESPGDSWYGLGTWRVGDDRWGVEVVGHLGELPGYRTVLAVLPEHRVSIAIFTTGSAETAPYVPLLAKAAGLLPPPPP
ncbi:MAG TPA: serine hydrolase [Ornithinibacter sp.]|nr:serine hydrolase [Ornithinibacter sp.]